MGRRGFGKSHHSWIIKRLVWGILFLMLAFFVSGFAQKTTKNNEIKGEIDRLKEEITQYEQKNAQLQSLVSYFSTDDFVEEEARTKLGLKKEGEHVVIITNTQENKKEVVQKPLVKASKTNLEKWWDYVFGE